MGLNLIEYQSSFQQMHKMTRSYVLLKFALLAFDPAFVIQGVGRVCEAFAVKKVIAKYQSRESIYRSSSLAHPL